LSGTNVGRDINRHYYDAREIKDQLEQPVVKALFKLIKFRNEHPSFSGDFYVEEDKSETLHVIWKKNNFKSSLEVNLQTGSFSIGHTDGNKMESLMTDKHV